MDATSLGNLVSASEQQRERPAAEAGEPSVTGAAAASVAPVDASQAAGVSQKPIDATNQQPPAAPDKTPVETAPPVSVQGGEATTKPNVFAAPVVEDEAIGEESPNPLNNSGVVPMDIDDDAVQDDAQAAPLAVVPSAASVTAAPPAATVISTAPSVVAAVEASTTVKSAAVDQPLALVVKAEPAATATAAPAATATAAAPAPVPASAAPRAGFDGPPPLIPKSTAGPPTHWGAPPPPLDAGATGAMQQPPPLTAPANWAAIAPDITAPAPTPVAAAAAAASSVGGVKRAREEEHSVVSAVQADNELIARASTLEETRRLIELQKSQLIDRIASKPQGKHRVEVETRRKVAATGEISLSLAECAQVVKKLSKRPGGQAFSAPVDYVAYAMEGYLEKIDNKPMDLGQVIKNLRDHLYEDCAGVYADVRRTFKNCEIYWGADALVSQTAQSLSKQFETAIKSQQGLKRFLQRSNNPSAGGGGAGGQSRPKKAKKQKSRTSRGGASALPKSTKRKDDDGGPILGSQTISRTKKLCNYLRANPSEIHNPKLAFFKDFISTFDYE